MNPTPQTPTPATPPERLALIVAILLFAGLLLYRGYGSPFLSRPSTQITAPLPLNVNTADRTELLQVPGVGPSLADAIVSHRETFGAFTSLDELDGVRGVGGKTLEKLRPWLAVPSEPTTRAQQPTIERLERKPPVAPPAVPVYPGAVQKLKPGEQLDVNTATLEQLQQLPGIGVKLAERIVAAREDEPFRVPEDLRRVSGIGVKTVEKLRPHLRFTTSR